MKEELTCMECGEQFVVVRKPANRKAVIRFCDRCKDGFDYIRKTERGTRRTAIDRLRARGRTAYLSVN